MQLIERDNITATVDPKTYFPISELERGFYDHTYQPTDRDFEERAKKIRSYSDGGECGSSSEMATKAKNQLLAIGKVEKFMPRLLAFLLYSDEGAESGIIAALKELGFDMPAQYDALVKGCVKYLVENPRSWLTGKLFPKSVLARELKKTSPTSATTGTSSTAASTPTAEPEPEEKVAEETTSNIKVTISYISEGVEQVYEKTFTKTYPAIYTPEKAIVEYAETPVNTLINNLKSKGISIRSASITLIPSTGAAYTTILLSNYLWF